MHAVAYSPDGQMLATGSGDQTVKILKFKIEFLQGANVVRVFDQTLTEGQGLCCRY